MKPAAAARWAWGVRISDLAFFFWPPEPQCGTCYANLAWFQVLCFPCRYLAFGIWPAMGSVDHLQCQPNGGIKNNLAASLSSFLSPVWPFFRLYLIHSKC